MPPLGFIPKRDRTRAQQDAHRRAEASFKPSLALAPPSVPKGTKVLLSDSWKAPEVVADVGFVFPRFHQLTGSCVGAGGGQALFTLIAVQRLLAQSPTKAFLPFWPYDYGRSRSENGDTGQGEGSLGSWFAQVLIADGVLDAQDKTLALPQFQNNDGLVLTNQLEMEWSDGDGPAAKFLSYGKPHPLGAAAVCKSVQDVKAALLNGYPVTFACDDYVGNGTLQGSGDNAVVLGKYDGQGGHQQSVHGYWEHPDLGPLYLWLNNWAGSTYPILPTQPVCSVWMKESDAQDAIDNLDAEVYALSHLSWFPAQPDVLDWFV